MKTKQKLIFSLLFCISGILTAQNSVFLKPALRISAGRSYSNMYPICPEISLQAFRGTKLFHEFSFGYDPGYRQRSYNSNHVDRSWDRVNLAYKLMFGIKSGKRFSFWAGPSIQVTDLISFTNADAPYDPGPAHTEHDFSTSLNISSQLQYSISPKIFISLDAEVPLLGLHTEKQQVWVNELTTSLFEQTIIKGSILPMPGPGVSVGIGCRIASSSKN